MRGQAIFTTKAERWRGVIGDRSMRRFEVIVEISTRRERARQHFQFIPDTLFELRRDFKTSVKDEILSNAIGRATYLDGTTQMTKDVLAIRVVHRLRSVRQSPDRTGLLLPR